MRPARFPTEVLAFCSLKSIRMPAMPTARKQSARAAPTHDSDPVRLRDFKVVRPDSDSLVAERVVEQLRGMIRQGKLKPGDRLPAERELAQRLGVSRASLRHGLRFLAAIGILNSRHGSGTYIADGPPVLKSESLQVLADLHRFSYDEMFEARRVLECALAELA